MPARPFKITQLSGDAQVHAGRGILTALLASPATSGALSLVLYDSLTASGTKLIVLNVTEAACPVFLQFGTQPGLNIPFAIGLYADLTNCQLTLWTTGAVP
jgi:hypothetical protein